MALLDFLLLTPKSSIGGIEIQASLEEMHTDTLQVTEHPIEVGAPVTDHSYVRPSEVVIKAGWSNSNLDALIGAVTSFFDGGEMSQSDYVSGIYSQLLALQSSREPFDITTSRRQYTDMLITSLAVTTDQKTSNILTVSATCRQVLMVYTQATTLPPKENQAEPISTAETENVGTKSATPNASPAPGGSAPPVAPRQVGASGSFQSGASGSW